MNQKEIAMNFLKLAACGEVREAYEKYIAQDFIHHNQYFKGDRDSLMKAMEEASVKSPNKSIEIKKCYQDGDTVITHSLVQVQDKSRPSVAVVHISKIKDNKIVELWDLGQEIMKDSPNENSPF